MSVHTAAFPRERILSEKEFWVGGGLAGVEAGIVMALAAMIRSTATGAGFWLPMKTIAAVWYGVDALIGGPVVILAGITTHLAVSAAFGILFGMVVHRQTRMELAYLKGIVYGILLWLFMTYFVLPKVDPVMQARVLLQQPWWLIDHLIYGALLCFTPALRRYISQRR